MDEAKHIWTCEVRIPLKALASAIPEDGARWPANFYRGDKAAKAGLAWRPTLQGSFHVPERFGILEFGE